MEHKLNCWEFKNCGRQPQGHSSILLGVCPASTEARLDGAHEGVNAGRACWVVAGTFCGGTTQGTFAQKYDNCANCDFFNAVKKEHIKAGDYLLSISLLGKMREIA